MINFRLKVFTEYEAMRSLYVELKKAYREEHNKIEVINQSQLIPILKGNNIVIEKFVVNKAPFGPDTYRMYLKIGARAKMPDAVRLPGRPYTSKLGNLSLKFKGGFGGGTQLWNENNNHRFSNTSDDCRIKLFDDHGGGGNNKKKGGGGDNYGITSEYSPFISLEKTEMQLPAEVLQYDKLSRTLILETKTIWDAINALKILPFGIEYNIYLLDA